MQPVRPHNKDDSPPLVKVAAKSAAEVCRGLYLDDESLALLRPGQTPRQFLDALLAHEQFADAVKFLASALPPREAVWWACLCLRLFWGDTVPPAPATALMIATRWVLDPAETYRAVAARMATDDNPRDFLLRAVAWTGGSLTPPPLPPVPPDPSMPASAVRCAILLMATKAPEKTMDNLRHFLAVGIWVARGKLVWPATAPPRPTPTRRPDR